MNSDPKMKKEEENKFEKDIRFIARHYDPARLDVNRAWNSFSVQKGVRKVFPFRTFLLSAAALLLLLFGFRGWFVWNKNQPEWVVIAAVDGNIKHVTLPDQTFVVLAPGTEIRYDAKRFNKKSREIDLTGKASFEVHRDENKMFMVSTSLSLVKVLGTTFELRDRGESVDISVFTGKVSFSVERGEKEVLLTKGMNASYSVEQAEIEVDRDVNLNRLSWQRGELIFDNTPLLQVIKDVENYYDVDLVNLPDETDLQLTASFSNLSLPDVLLIINQTLDIHLMPKQN